MVATSPQVTRTRIYKYVRKVNGHKFQARIYYHFGQTTCGQYAGTHLHLGLYYSEAEAWQAVRDFVRTGRRPAHLLPRFIYRCASTGPHAGLFVGRVRLRSHGMIRTKPLPTAAAADRAMRRILARKFGKEALARFYPLG